LVSASYEWQTTRDTASCSAAKSPSTSPQLLERMFECYRGLPTLILLNGFG
jgi:hypothetical protein